MAMSEMGLMVFGQQQAVEPVEFHLESMREVYQTIRETQEEVGGSLTFRVKTPSGGGKAFDILTGDEEQDTSVPTFKGVIVFQHKCNALFDEEMSGNTPPLCSSIDGIRGLDSGTGEVRSCRGCPHNEYGTAKKGRGKACKNMQKLYIMTEWAPVPLVLCLPPTSLKNYQTYCLSSLAMRGLKAEEVLTEFGLTVDQNSDGIKYSKVKFKLSGKLTEEAKAAAGFFAAGLKEAASVSAEDYDREKKPAKPDAEADPTDFDDENMPF